MRNHRYVHGRGKDLEGGALAMDIQGIREGALFAMHERRYTVDDWRYDTAHREQTENGQKG